MQRNSRREQALTILFIGVIAFLFIFQASISISPHKSVSFQLDRMNLAYGYGLSNSDPVCIPVDPAIEFYHSFDEDSGTTLIDWTTSGFTGTRTNGTLISGSVPTLGYANYHSNYFDGVNDYIDVGNTSMVTPTTFSVSAWVRPLSAGSDRQIISKGSFGPQRSEWELKTTTADGKISFQLGIAGVLYGVQSLTAPTVGQWSHIVGTFNGTIWKIYINGALNNSNTAITTPVLRNLKIHIGALDDSGTPTQFWAGRIDETRFYSRELTLSQVGELYAGACDVTFGSSSSSSSSSSSAPTCGNGTKAVDEGCDDSNTTAGDGCSATCTVESGWSCTGTTPSSCTQVCGNSIITSSETCDDGNATAGDGCSATCIVQSGWSCSGTPSSCNQVCGNGIITVSEVCDDGNTSNGDGCTSACALQSGWSCTGTPSSCSTTCGDGIVAGSEACDDGNATDTDSCRNSCIFASCGDSIVQTNGLDGIPANADDEACDEGGETATCNDTCTSVACGDQNINQAAGETCDDGNASNTDACLNSCVSASCGDSYIRSAVEQCDPPGVGTCSSSCQEANGISGGNSQQESSIAIITRRAPSPFCGNGVTQADKDEECDEGRFNGLSPTCDRWCKMSFCGDGLVQNPKEECEPILQDDGTYAAQTCGGRICTVPICTEEEDCVGGCNWVFLPACRVEKAADTASFEIPKRVTANDGIGPLEVASPIKEIKSTEPLTFEPPADPSFLETESSSSSATPSTIVIDPPLELPVFSIGIQESSSSSASSIRDVLCGNGIREEDEECDDGVRNSNVLPDSCRTSCSRSLCGDSVTDYGEECDDGNDILGDGCTPLCTISACGNNTLEPGEECDDGIMNSDTKPDSCSSRCLQPRCGDGLLDASFGEACDQGEDNSNSIPDRCRLNCRRPYCGDGIKDSDERCDDGNASNLDFCSNSCIIVGCGNGVIERSEACDDGNTVAGDGCSVACILEKKSFIQWLNNAIRLPFQW